MDKNLLGTNIVTQIGIIVKDIEKASQAFADFFGVEKPKWNWTDGYDKSHAEFNGKPSDARAKLAFFDMGQVQIELIEPDENISTWREFLDKHGEGVHHIAFQVKDMDEKIEALEKNGMPLVQKGDYEGGRYAYIDTFSKLKVIIELLENF
ncbi:lactoylglutathione lyase and related lyase [Thermoanaerobacterium thermosaccharolyticum DSM 571]|uniref:Lactoylglutathione lyase and related lyase n=1 Tax=Thermoanaerobacterium thermosaccharolyticum (strain ATCC 7956 / DSM 571 / NCIMB 9385 / NCA 3814 / NCTC 13789 / WDCM 00135 / 2032) TaxID=580327 RepID=D9TTG7_THETC|nr:VOC family protein [Thermoanaerobacterium thermosaccharolyticum]ADL69426.1 lactoylglutathione lyase and related lyase [Thermoanaerobacterium thermosaccharolyticum DSM 571]